MYTEGVVEVNIQRVKLIPRMEVEGQTLECVLHLVCYASENKKVVSRFYKYYVLFWYNVQRKPQDIGIICPNLFSIVC